LADVPPHPVKLAVRTTDAAAAQFFAAIIGSSW
jgi:hypothetical protein